MLSAKIIVSLRPLMPVVSVVIPVYKVEPFIARCARSLFRQTLEDIEYIFVDDCSPDRSMEVMQEVLEEFPSRKQQVKCIHLPQNGGLAHARLVGVAAATGDYLINCDSDDWVEDDAYRMMCEKAVKEDLDMVICSFTYVSETENNYCMLQKCKCGREVANLLSRRAMASVWCRMARRALWQDMIPPQGEMWEDLFYSVQLTTKARRIEYLPNGLYYYYRHPDSITCSQGVQAALKRRDGMVANARLIIDYLKRRPEVNLDKSDTLILKYSCRLPLMEYMHLPGLYREWRNTFPEINARFWYTPGVLRKDKITFLLTYLHLYRLCRFL